MLRFVDSDHLGFLTLKLYQNELLQVIIRSITSIRFVYVPKDS